MVDTLEWRFAELQKERPNHSSYILFTRLMMDQEVSNKRIFVRYFNKFVDRSDFNPKDKRKLLNSLFLGVVNKGFSGTKKYEIAPVASEKCIPSTLYLYS